MLGLDGTHRTWNSSLEQNTEGAGLAASGTPSNLHVLDRVSSATWQTAELGGPITVKSSRLVIDKFYFLPGYDLL